MFNGFTNGDIASPKAISCQIKIPVSGVKYFPQAVGQGYPRDFPKQNNTGHCS